MNRDETLTDALLRHGIRHQASSLPGRRELFNRDELPLGLVSSKQGWEMVRKLDKEGGDNEQA